MIAYVAAMLEKQHKVKIIDSPMEGWNNLQPYGATYRVGLTNEETAERIKQWSPDVVGINIPFSGWAKAALEVADAVKEVDSDIATVLDGLHPSARPIECLSDPNVDYVIRGESDYTMLELVNALEQGKNNTLEEIAGIGFVKNGKPVITQARPEIENLDSLPLPARHLLPMEKYFKAVKEKPLRGVINRRWAAVLSSRGCPYRCTFCSHFLVQGRRWRGRSPENVVNEIEQLVKEYSVEQIDFVDNNLTYNKKRIEKICDLIVERGLDIEWYAPDGVRADTLDENLLRKMKRSGCKKIRLAPESGVQRIVDGVIKKNLKLEDVERALILAKKVGIRVGIFFILGLVGETKEDMKETIRYARKLKKLGAENFHFSVATPLYGTELYDLAEKGGYLTEGFNDDALAGDEPLIETPEFTPEDVKQLCIEANEINQAITCDKILKAIKDPRRAVETLRMILFSKKA